MSYRDLYDKTAAMLAQPPTPEEQAVNEYAAKYGLPQSSALCAPSRQQVKQAKTWIANRVAEIEAERLQPALTRATLRPIDAMHDMLQGLFSKKETRPALHEVEQW